MSKHQLPQLPYSYDALQPVISKETLEFHHDKHHKAYVEKTNQLIAGTPWENESLEAIIRGTFQKEMKIFNQAAQVWNHTFYWNSMSPKNEHGGKLESPELKSAIDHSFGDFDKFKKLFNEAASGVFGSGWAWLIADDQGNLKIETTSNADNPLRKNETALLTCDVWEHAYYIDYRNARAKYLENIWSILNWDFAARNYSRLSKTSAA